MGDNCFKIPPLSDDRSIIVVSDLHLGGKEDKKTSERFCNFLDYLKSNPNRDVKGCSKNKRILPPEKIILLGDILELWDSYNQDRNNAFLDAIIPFRKLQDMDCDVVYVTGNHDEDIVEYITSLKDYRGKQREKECKEKVALLCSKKDPKKDKKPNKPESIQFYWNDKNFLEICSRHYPSPKIETEKGSGKNGVEAGKLRYAFLHGHQFDKIQITYPVKQTLGRCFDPIDYLQDLANISFSKMVGKRGFIVPIITLVLFCVFYYWQKTSWTQIPGAATGLIFTGIFLICSYLFFSNIDNLKSKITLCGLSLLFSFLFLWMVIMEWFWGLFWIGFCVSVYLLFIIGIPVGFAWGKKGIYNGITSIKNKLPESFFKWAFEGDIYEYRTDILVFGHTHKPDFTTKTNTDKIKLLVNTGSWVNNNKAEYDTFAYIDKDGICCMKWVDYSDPKNERNKIDIEENGHIECFCSTNEEKKIKNTLCQFEI